MTRHNAVGYGDDTRPRGGLNPAETVLTAGHRSSIATLTDQFRRSHRDHVGADPVLYRRMESALTRLTTGATGREVWDVVRWYALYGRLDSIGYDVDWMQAHVEPRCVDCEGRLRYELADGTVTGVCNNDCGDDRLDAFRSLVDGLYHRTFDEPLDATRIIVP